MPFFTWVLITRVGTVAASRRIEQLEKQNFCQLVVVVVVGVIVVPQLVAKCNQLWRCAGHKSCGVLDIRTDIFDSLGHLYKLQADAAAAAAAAEAATLQRRHTHTG